MKYLLVLITTAVFLIIADAVLASTTNKLITVDTQKQMLYAWEGGKIIDQFSVSTGLWQTPTVKGNFRIYWKLSSQNMRGYSLVNGWYYHPNVTHVMYFYRDYAIHGAYWHSNFGHPMSNGCINLPLDKAEWLYNFTPVGTKVLIF